MRQAPKRLDKVGPNTAGTSERAEFGGRHVAWMSMAAGVSVANIYYVQPLLRPLATSFAVSDALAGLLPMITMVGYAAGLLLVVPVLETAGLHRLMRWLNAGRLFALALAASATGYPVFAVASVLLGATSVLAQILMPAAASLVPPEAVGRITARVTAGLFGGIVGARVLAGALDGLLGWRAVYALSALATLIVHLALRRLPEPPLRHALGYRALLRSLLPLLRSERGLRRAALTAAAGFAAFNLFWTPVTLYVTGPAHGWSTTGAGLLGLVGVVGTATVLVTGRFLDRGAHKGLAVAAAGVMALGLLIAGLWGAVGRRAHCRGTAAGLRCTCEQRRQPDARPQAASRSARSSQHPLHDDLLRGRVRRFRGGSAAVRTHRLDPDHPGRRSPGRARCHARRQSVAKRASLEAPYAVRSCDIGGALTDKRHRCTGSRVAASEETEPTPSRR